MTSHKTFGGIKLTVGEGGIRFTPRKSGFNICVGKEMKGVEGGGRYDKDFQKLFVKATFDCGATISASKKKKWGITGTKGSALKKAKAKAEE